MLERQVFENMLGEDEGHGLRRRWEPGTKVEPDIGMDGPIDVDIHPPIESVLSTAKLYFGVLWQRLGKSRPCLRSGKLAQRCRCCRHGSPLNAGPGRDAELH
jgi:hypothetical protein